MPKATKNSVHGNNTLSQAEEMVPNSEEELSSSEQEPNPEISFHTFRPPQPVPSMFIPCIEDSKNDWTVHDGLYYRFLKWHLKCENILECELAALPEQQQSKKVIAQSGDIFWYFLHNEEFFSKTINEGNVDLDKFPASKVRQLAK